MANEQKPPADYPVGEGPSFDWMGDEAKYPGFSDDETLKQLTLNHEASKDALEAYLQECCNPKVLTALRFGVTATEYAVRSWKEHHREE